MPVPVLVDINARLIAARADVEDAKTAYDNALELRDRVVADAVDGGMAQAAVARLVGCSAPHIVKIMARSQPGNVLP